MARAIWSGAISFGLVNIPVKLYSAVKRQTVRFHQLDSSDNTRIQQKRVNPNTGDEVPYEQLVKGYELSPDRYVVITPEELETVEPEKTRTIDIEAFVELDQIDPIYYDHPYYLAPGPGASKAYGLLLKALEDTDRVGIARVVIRSKEALVAIRAHQNVLTMETMLFGDEVVAPSDLGELPDPADVKAGKKEVDMARQLIESLSTDFDPDSFRDTYRDRVLEMIEAKAEGQEIEVQETPEAPAEVPDLMAALEASIAGAKRQGGQRKKSSSSKKGSSSTASSNGSKSSRSKRKTTAKK
ncbi:MAG TPA: Ku protein [Thermoleophilaceae bacterium]|nr:Ku protein [Thermoleophilaceae bacterium]